MENIIDMIATESSPVDIANEIKGALHSKALERIEIIKPYVANSLFGVESEEETEETDEVEED